MMIVSRIDNCILVGGAVVKWPKNKSPLIPMKLWDLLEVEFVYTMLNFCEKNPAGSASSGGKTV